VIDRKNIRIFTRLVRFGTSFQTSAEQYDPVAAPRSAKDLGDFLFANEIAVDIGGACVGYRGESRLVFDHHFAGREGNFPSAAAALLHLRRHIETWLDGLPPESPCIQIVTHQSPDFDALAAVTIAEELITAGLPNLPAELIGLSEDGWLPVPTSKNSGEQKINWFDPRTLHYVPAQSRWLFWIACVASLTDQCKPYRVPFHLRLPSYLAAAIVRGRRLESDEERRRFFQVIRRELDAGANPLCDLLLDNSSEYRRETALLHLAPAAYESDLRRARLAAVPVPVEPGFRSRYENTLKATPLLNEAGEINPEHLAVPPGAGRQTVDGVFLRDPVCPVFKDLARQDVERSPSGKGFRFTAVAISGKYPGRPNTSEYYFALDPEAIPDAHLYPVWALLQSAEIAGRKALSIAPDGKIRDGFEGRAPHAETHFLDPWFDGSNYACTIVVSPGNGAVLLPEGSARNLGDDGAAAIVSHYLELSPYAGPYTAVDYPPGTPRISSLDHFAILPPNSFRFVSVPLVDSVTAIGPGLAPRIGNKLWQWLHGDPSSSVPTDFDSRHLWWSQSCVGVWSRKGMAIAALPGALAYSADVQQILATVAQVSAAHSGTPSTLEELRVLLRSVAQLRWTAAHSACRLPARFLAAMEFDTQIELLHDLHAAEAAGDNLSNIQKLLRHASLIEVFIFSIYAVELAHLLAQGTHSILPGWSFAYLLGALALAIGSMLLSSRLENRSPNSKEYAGLSHRLMWPQMVAFVFIVGFGALISHAAHQKTAFELDNQKAIQAAERLDNQRRLDELTQAIKTLQVSPPAPAIAAPPATPLLRKR